jgi:hypothetical protein
MGRVMDLERSLGRIEGKLDSLVETLKAHVEDDRINFTQLEKHQFQLNKLVFMALGVITFLGVSVPAAIAYFK